MKDFVPYYDEALAVKELGFDEFCFATIDQTDYVRIKGTKKPPRGSMMYDTIDCPTFSQAFRFFREKYNFCGWVQEHYFKGLIFYQYHISRETLLDVISDIYETYEEAELECLKKLIEIAKQKN